MSWVSSLATVVCLVFFIGVCFWAFSPGRKEANRESANLPFALPDEIDEIRSRRGQGEAREPRDPREPLDPEERSRT